MTSAILTNDTCHMVDALNQGRLSEFNVPVDYNALKLDDHPMIEKMMYGKRLNEYMPVIRYIAQRMVDLYGCDYDPLEIGFGSSREDEIFDDGELSDKYVNLGCGVYLNSNETTPDMASCRTMSNDEFSDWVNRAINKQFGVELYDNLVKLEQAGFVVDRVYIYVEDVKESILLDL